MRLFRKKHKSRSLEEAKAENLKKIRESFERGDETPSALPAVLYVEATSTCNLRCPMCPITMDIPEYKYAVKTFDLELLDTLEPALRNAKRCFLSGGGEPFLHPGLFEIISRVKAAGVEVIFNSNGTLLTEDRARGLIEHGVECVSFSIDGATARTYESIRIPAKFENTMENIKRLARMKKERGSELPCINIQFTVIRSNYVEIPDMVPLALDLDANQLVIEPLTPVFNFNPVYKKYYDENMVPFEKALPLANEAKARAEKTDLIMSSHYLFREQNPGMTTSCGQPWHTLGVRVDGRVFTCCGTPEKMGNLYESGLNEIWNGEAYRGLRRELSSARFPGFCSLCIEENRASHFNEDLLE